MRVRTTTRLISSALRTSPTVNGGAFEFLPLCNKAKTDWTIAQPLMNMPPYLKNKQLVPSNLISISPVGGSKLLVNSATEYFVRQGIKKCTNDNIVVGNGVLDILDNVYELLEIKENQQKILIATPTFGMFYTNCLKKGLKTDFLETTKENEWKIDPKKLRQKLEENPDIKILLLNFPNNPTGKVLREENAKMIADVLLSYPDILVISDEALQDIFLEEKLKSFSIASLPQMAERTLVVTSPSKTRALASARVAFAHMPSDMTEHYKKLLRNQMMMEDIFLTSPYIQDIVAESYHFNLNISNYSF